MNQQRHRYINIFSADVNDSEYKTQFPTFSQPHISRKLEFMRAQR